MKSLKHHLSFIIPLFALLFSIELTTFISKLLLEYESNILGEYSIFVSANKAISKEDLAFAKEIGYISEVSPNDIVEDLKGSLSSKALESLEKTLPKFYSIKLNYFPSQKDIKHISKSLKDNPVIINFEVFINTYNILYNSLLLLKGLLILVSLFVIVVSILLILKQMEVWCLRHQDTMYILELFGSPFWFKSMTLYKSVVLDSIVCVFLVMFIFAISPHLNFISSFFIDLNMPPPKINIPKESLSLFLVSFFIAVFCVTFVVLFKNRNKK